MITVGLFGTCGHSQWRVPFKQVLSQHNVPFFDPVVPNWTPDNAVIEAEHLASDEIILFPVTNETFGFGSLAESGFSIMSVLSSPTPRQLIVYIAPDVEESLYASDATTASLSRNARALVRAHLSKVDLSASPCTLYVVESLDEMMSCLLAVLRKLP